MEFKDKLELLLTLPHLYEESLISRIDPDHKIRPVESPLEVFDDSLKTIKVEELDRVFKDIYLEAQKIKKERNHEGPCTAHLFWAPPNGPSFTTHEDPYDILLRCIYGTKTLEIDGKRVVLDENNPEIWIPCGGFHRGTNEFEAIMISYGCEHFLEHRWNL